MKNKLIFFTIPVILLCSLQITFAKEIPVCVVGVLPDLTCSPGAVLTTDVKTICTVGYTKTVRDVSTPTRKKVFKEYGIPYSQHSDYEVDHIISLELGGSNDITNLYPESYTITNGARTKDKFENYLHRQICKGLMDIKEAQKEISTDWLMYYQEIKK